MVNLESVKVFIAVAAETSVTRAAARLGKAPSNVTTRIQQLEAELGAELFVRTGKRMTLSTAGQRFLVYAQRMLALEDEARHVVNGGNNGGTLRIGSMESTAASRLPSPLAAYNSDNPATRLEVSTGPSGLLIEQVRNGQLDCAFVALPVASQDEPGLTELGLQGLSIWEEELLLLLPANEADAQTTAQLHTRSLAAFRLGCTYRTIAEVELGISAGSGWTVQELGSYHAMIAAVSAGSCVTLLPRSVLTLSGAPAELPTLNLGSNSTYLVWRNGYDIPAFQRFVRLFKQG